MKRIKVLIIIPTYNEINNINIVIKEITNVQKKHSEYKFNILIIDDHSPDGTANLIKKLQKKQNNIELISGQKKGLGKAYLHGLEYALNENNHDVFVMMDGDLSHHPEDIPNLLEPLRHGWDFVIGSRYTKGALIDKSWPILQKVKSFIANFFVHKLVGIDNIADTTSGFKAIKCQAIRKINLSKIKANGYFFQVSLLHASLQNRLKVKEIPISFTERNSGSSKVNFKDVLEFIYQSYKLNRNAPIQKFVRFGLVGICGTFFNLVILILLVNFMHFNALLAVLVAIEGSIIFNFFLNHIYTFKGYGSYPFQTKKENLSIIFLKLKKYNLGALGGAIISYITFVLFFKIIHFQYIFADIFSILIAMTWNYWISTHYVWKTIDNFEQSPTKD